MKYLIIILIFIVVAYLLFQFLYPYKFKRSLFFEETYIEKNKKYLKKIEKNTDTLYLHQTYFDKSKIPVDIYTNIKKYAPEYKHVIYDDNDIISFLKEYFDPCVLDTFHLLKNGAHKADLARYCILYIYGGLYLDIKTELVMPISKIFKKRDTFYSVISSFDNHIYQGIISSKPNNPLFLSLIDYIVTVGNPFLYHDFCSDLYYQIGTDTKISPGLRKGTSQNYYLFEEKCSILDDSMCYDGFDQYNLCCFVYDGDKPIIKTRRSSYPWK